VWKEKVYLQPIEMVFSALLDLMELQKGEEILNDSLSGKLHFKITMYGFVMELRFTILDMDWNRCGVTLEIPADDSHGNDDGDDLQYLKDTVRLEFAMLDSMLLIGTPFEVSYS